MTVFCWIIRLIKKLYHRAESLGFILAAVLRPWGADLHRWMLSGFLKVWDLKTGYMNRAGVLAAN